MSPRTDIVDTASGLLRAYASILFTEKPWVGSLFVLATFWFPNAGLSGLLAALAAMVTARLLQFRNLESGLHLYNSLLVGLSLGAYYQLDIYLALLIILGAIMAVFATVAFADLLWRMDRLPALSLPFVLVALTTTLAAHSYGTLSRYLVPLTPHDLFFTSWIDQFFTALGSAFFTPHPLPGLLMFIGLLLTSRYLALLAVFGFTAGYATYALLSGSPHPDLVAWNGFNFILVAIAIGGIFTVPGKQSFILAMVGSVLAALITAATETFMLVYGLPVMALPFLATTMMLLIALQKRPASRGLQLLLDAPALPEKSYERARLATVRHGEFGSVPVCPPFYGRWMVYQGFDGKHTHQAPWQHALDFFLTDNHGRSFRSDGVTLQDYFCFGLPIVSPVEGYVVQTNDRLEDNQPGHVDMENNWGNYILIRMPQGLYLLLAHLKQGSIDVDVGSYLRPGQSLAQCGSSGRSPQPHLHMHVQWGEALGSATHPFHLTTVLLQKEEEQTQKFQLFARPKEGEIITTPKTDHALRTSMQLPVGRTFHYQLCGSAKGETEGIERLFTVVLTLTGEMRLKSDSGASAAFEYGDHLLAFYDRQGPEDLLLDCWLLALGLTPFPTGELSWCDQPPVELMPMTKVQRLEVNMLKPLGGGVDSRYHRCLQIECWQQKGEHTVERMMNKALEVRTEARIQPHLGCVRLDITTAEQQFEIKLLKVGQQADGGIPQWHVNTYDIR
ncbi:MAG: urea transporter [Mariprofundaceae bacterium]